MKVNFEMPKYTNGLRCHIATCFVRKILAFSLYEYVIDEAIACTLTVLCDVKFSQIEGNGRKFRQIELSNSVIS